ncbi:tetratricopeptide repeat protein [Phormidium nigroviride]
MVNLEAKEWFARGKEQFERGDFDDAIASWDKAIEIKPDLHQVWSLRGIVLDDLGRNEEAIASLDKAIEFKPDLHDAWYLRGLVLFKLGRIEEAIASYNKAIEIKPDYHDAWYFRGMALDDLGQFEEAIASYNKAIEIQPDYHEAWYLRGVARGNLGQFEEAIASYNKAIEFKPDLHDAWYNRGGALFNLRQFEEAIASYNKAIEIKPDYHKAWYFRGGALGKLGRFEEAIASYNKAIEIKPDYHEALSNRGVALRKLGRNEEASTSYDKASEKSPTAQPEPDLDWIKTIAKVGNSSDGIAFEKLCRKSLIELGFGNSNTNPKASLDPESTGGAGGLDFYCETPYQVVGECKATKSETVADGTPALLIKLGHKHLQEKYNCCIKIIIAAGQLNKDAKKTAIGNHINVIRPETLQKLVELKAKHPGSINLLELKPYLEQKPFGEDADKKVNAYINKILEEIKLRSHIISILKQWLENTGHERISVDFLFGAYTFHKPPKQLSREDFHEILIELSSPLIGYLGRIKGESLGRDSFYFLRDLIIDE